MSQIKITNMSFKYADQPIFENVNVEFDTNYKLGLVGRNGYGKTTFLKILQNQLDYNGEITKNVNFNYFPIAIKNPKLTTVQNLALAGVEISWELDRELNLLGLNPDILSQTFGSLSGGEQTKVMLAVAFINEDDFVLLDEPTNHLDMKTRDQVARYLRQKRQGLIIVSHDQNFIDQIIDHTLAIDKVGIHLYNGNYQTYQDQTTLQNESQQAQNKKLKHEINRLKARVQQKKAWSLKEEAKKRGAADKGFVGAQAARMMKRSKAIEQRMEKSIAEKKQLLKNVEEQDQLQMTNLPTHQTVLVEGENLSLGFSDRELIHDLNFQIKKGEVVALTGDNGSGKSTLIEAITEKNPPNLKITGEIVKINNLIVSQVQQNAQHFGNLADFATNHKISYEELLHTLRQLGVARSKFQTPIEQMSMGEQKRVELAKSLLTPAQLFIWDEPLNYLDIYNADQIIEVIKRLKPTMLVVEHDQRFLDQIKTEEIRLKK